MKKIFLLLFAFTFLTACSDDDTTDSEDDRILGKWFLADWNIPTMGDPTECNQQTNITFNADNTADSEFFDEDNTGECVSEADSSEWTRESNGQYTFDVPGVGMQTGDVTFNGDNSFTFTVTGASITFEK